jgi:hypothetical protein
MIEASCHCGHVKMEIARAPRRVTSCNCSICRRTGALLAYYKPSQVRFTGKKTPAAKIYKWGDKMLEFHHCPKCFCFTHWSAVDKTYDRMGVNARLMPPEILAKARVRHFDGAKTWKFLD